MLDYIPWATRAGGTMVTNVALRGTLTHMAPVQHATVRGDVWLVARTGATGAVVRVARLRGAKYGPGLSASAVGGMKVGGDELST